jgi:UDP-glucuronate decarboxylase
VHPQSESYWGHVNPIGPRANYDEGKRVAETLMFSYQRQNAVDVRVVRIFNTYGPRMATDDGRVVSNFVIQALRGEPLTVYGDGAQTRSFCFVSDLVEGMVRMMEQDRHPGPVNLGNPEEFTMLELASLVRQLAGSDSPVNHLELPEDDPRQRRPDITLAADLLGWQPTVSVRDGLRRTIDYFRTIVS